MALKKSVIDKLKKTSLARIGSIGLLFCRAMMTIALPIPILLIIDAALPRVSPLSLRFWQSGVGIDGAQLLLLCSLALLLLAWVKVLVDQNAQLLLARIKRDAVASYRAEIFQLYLASRAKDVDGKSAETKAKEVLQDTDSLGRRHALSLRLVAGDFPTLILAIGVVAFVNLRLTAELSGLLLVLASCTWYLRKEMRHHFQNQEKENGILRYELARILTSLAPIKATQSEKGVFEFLRMHDATSRHYEHSVQIAQSLLSVSQSSMKNILRALIVFFGGSAVLNGHLTLGGLWLFFANFEILTDMLGHMGRGFRKYLEAEPAFHRQMSLRQELHKQIEIDGTQLITSLPFPDATDLKFENVSFAREEGAFLLNEFNALFAAGEMIALVGPSAQAIRNFTLLLNRLHDPIEGRILIGRTDIRKFHLSVLRSYVSVLLSEPYFLPGTIRENLQMAAPDRDLDERLLSEVLHAAGAYDFVQALPQRLETPLMPHLDADHKRRIALTQAFLRPQAQIFVLPEALLDFPDSKQTEIFSSLRRLCDRGAIVFCAVNEAKDLENFDRVLFFQEHQNPLLETHPILLQTNPLYHSHLHSHLVLNEA